MASEAYSMGDPEQHMTVPEVAELLRVSETFVRREAASGRLPSRVFSNRRRFVRVEVLAYSKAHLDGAQVIPLPKRKGKTR